MFKQKLLLIAIILLAGIFRFSGVNWDQNTHLHPDERFLTMVGIDLKISNSFSNYLDPEKSTLNPTNILDASGNKKYPFYVYGSLPITLNKIFAVISENDNYNGFTITGRILSAFLDLLVVVIIFKSIKLLEEHYKFNTSLKLWASFLYAVSVLPIQLSHFFTVDSFLNAFMFISWYFVLKYYLSKKTGFLLLSAIFIGFALSSKITAVYILPLIFFFILATHVQIKNLARHNFLLKIKELNKPFLLSLFMIFIYSFFVYITLRIAYPYLFQNANFVDPRISQLLIQNWQTLKSWEGANTFFPPSIQWITTLPVLFSLKNLALFGVGLPYFVLIIIGLIYIIAKYRKPLIIITTLWLIIFFIFQSIQFVKVMRYFAFLYPFFAIFGAAGILVLKTRLSKPLLSIIFVILLIWPSAFLSIYLRPHSRLQATHWIYQNLPSGSIIAWELWDDPLPLPIPLYAGQTYQFRELPVFDPDTPEKWTTLNNYLKEADYYILSSNRAWGSIPTVPNRYPKMTRFYKDLFAGKTTYKQVAVFTSYPSLKYIGIPLEFADDKSDESFTVYDHPKVIIFKNTRESEFTY